MTTRPITDRVKESVFAVLQPRLADALVADLFCGTGSMGLEALSRGARHAIFVDLDRDALERLAKNIAALDFESQATVLRADVFRHALPTPQEAPQAHLPQEQPDLVFVDPPYRLSRRTRPDDPLGKLLAKLSRRVGPGGLVIVRHERHSNLEKSYQTLLELDCREYGAMAVTFLENPRE
jgi:16S rRNA (guanine966-N2)-methyltransferase